MKSKFIIIGEAGFTSANYGKEGSLKKSSRCQVLTISTERREIISRIVGKIIVRLPSELNQIVTPLYLLVVYF
jgi:hypothetical protein